MRLCHLALVALSLCAAGARADTFDITIINATFSATCVGGTGTCTEVVNGSFLGNSLTNTVTFSSLSIAGTLNASLGWGTPSCSNQNLCLLDAPGLFYDINALTGNNPIEFGPSLPNSNFVTPTPEPLEGGPNGTALFVPGMCGGDQPLCNTTGAFPGGADYLLTSGTYTSVDVSAPESGSAVLLLAGVAVVGLFFRRRG